MSNAAGSGPKDRPKNAPHVAFQDDAEGDAREHGERAPSAHTDDLIGTSGTHGPPDDARGEEPYGELPPSSTAEGGGDD